MRFHASAITACVMLALLGAPEICGDLTDNNCDGPWDNTCSPVAVDGATWGLVKGTYR